MEFLEKQRAAIPDAVESPVRREFDFKREIVNFLNRSNSAETRRTYAMHLRQFFMYLKLKLPTEITDADVIGWRDWLKERSKDSTVKTKLACVRSFFEYLKHKDFIQINPANKYLIPPPKVADVLAGNVFDGGEIKNLLALPKTDSIVGARDYALMLLMLRTFMRVSEALSLRDTDFFSRKGNWHVRVKIKGGKRWDVPVPLEVKRAIDHYLFLDRDHRSLVKTSRDEGKFIFMPLGEKKRDATANRAICSRHAWHVVKTYGKLSGIGKEIKPHDFRRSSITRALDQGESYRRVQNAARLKSIQTVRRYDHHRESLEENSILTLNYDDE